MHKLETLEGIGEFRPETGSAVSVRYQVEIWQEMIAGAAPDGNREIPGLKRVRIPLADTRRAGVTVGGMGILVLNDGSTIRVMVDSRGFFALGGITPARPE